MSDKFDNIKEVAESLGGEYKNVREVVEDLIETGNEDKVSTFHDDHIGLIDCLPDEFLDSNIEDLNEERFESQIEKVIDQANIIIPLFNRDLSERDIDDINEDLQSLGFDPED